VSADIPKPGTPVSYDEHIRPLFREHDHESMRFAFDLWSYEDVSANATAIFEKLSTGAMPCDGAWCYRPRYLNIQRLNYLWTIRRSSARIAGNLVT
jgi:hypothetical protein